MPTDPEEVERLEAEYLTSAQEFPSLRREAFMKNLEEKTGLAGSIVRIEAKKPTEADPTYRDVFVGELAGHKVSITTTGTLRKEGNQSWRERSEVLATVWGKDKDEDKKIILTPGEADDLWVKLAPAMDMMEAEEYPQEGIKKIDAEREKFLHDEIKKDLGI